MLLLFEKLYMYILYKITNSINGKCYIGVTKRSLSERWRGHKHKAFTLNAKYKFSYALRKYGVDCWIKEILFSGIPEEEIEQLEIDTIKKYNSCEEGYNTSLGGHIPRGIVCKKGREHHSTNSKIYNFYNKDGRMLTGTILYFSLKEKIIKMHAQSTFSREGFYRNWTNDYSVLLKWRNRERKKAKELLVREREKEERRKLIASTPKVVKEKVVKKRIIKEKVIKEKVIKEKVVKEKAVKEKAVKEKVTKEKIIKEKIVKEKKIKKPILPKKEKFVRTYTLYNSRGIPFTGSAEWLSRITSLTAETVRRIIRSNTGFYTWYASLSPNPPRDRHGKNNPMFGKTRPENVKNAVRNRVRNSADPVLRDWYHEESGVIEYSIRSLDLRDKYGLNISHLKRITDKHPKYKTHKGWRLYETSN